ncbi:MAG: hypothetical protein WKG07_07055 [Hymenobacter sp.]
MPIRPSPPCASSRNCWTRAPSPPPEFEALKRQLIFGAEPPAPFAAGPTPSRRPRPLYPCLSRPR